MTKQIVVLTDRPFTEAERQRLYDGIQQFLTTLAPWGFDVIQHVDGATPVPNPEDTIIVRITNQKRHLGASGYHVVENGIPVAYCLPGTPFSRWGVYRPAKPLVKIGKYTFGARPAYLRGGMITTVCHEIAEILGDPLLATLAPADANGHQLLREIADPVFGINYHVAIKSNDFVLPVVVLPNWYILGSSVPYDTAGYCTCPFQKSPKGYAYWVSKLGRFIRDL